MKLHNILITEAIHTSVLQPEIVNILSTAFDNAVKQVSQRVIEIFDGYDDFMADGDLDHIIAPLSSAMTTWMCKESTRNTLKLISSSAEIPTSVQNRIEFSFTRDIDVEGSVTGLAIKINRKSVKLHLFTVLLREVRQTVDPTKPYNELLTAFINEIHGLSATSAVAAPRRGAATSQNRIIRSAIRNIAGTIVHELVHIVQHARQLHRDTTEYRSYLEPNARKFHAMLVALQNPNPAAELNFSTEDAYKAYRASPQEIPAFAHQMALEILDFIGFPDVVKFVDKKLILAELTRILPSTIGTMFTSKIANADHKVYKRYVKLVYQEVVYNIEREYTKQ